MCTLIVDLAPGRRCPVVLAAVRDEMLGRPWDPPGRHWPDHPGLVGGRDRLAGGTWLAFNPDADRVACVLNGVGPAAAPDGRRSRGELPLLAASGAPLPGGPAEQSRPGGPAGQSKPGEPAGQSKPGEPAGSGTLAGRAGQGELTGPAELAVYDPFLLVTADPTGLAVLTWNGHQPHRYRLGAGTHVFVNRGRWTGPADRRTPRATRFGPLFAAERPDPTGTGPVADDWAPWAALIDEPGGSPRDPDAVVATDPEVGWGTSSITLLGFGGTAPRYDFRPGPGPAPWRPVSVGGDG